MHFIFNCFSQLNSWNSTVFILWMAVSLAFCMGSRGERGLLRHSPKESNSTLSYDLEIQGAESNDLSSYDSRKKSLHQNRIPRHLYGICPGKDWGNVGSWAQSGDHRPEIRAWCPWAGQAAGLSPNFLCWCAHLSLFFLFLHFTVIVSIVHIYVLLMMIWYICSMCHDKIMLVSISILLNIE